MRLCLSLFTALLLCPLAVSHAADAPNIFGLKLGMTPDEAEKTLKENRPDLKVERTMTSYSYSDGVAEQKTPEIVLTVTGTKSKPPADGAGQDDETIILSFTQQPTDQQLVAIGRTQTAIAKPVAFDLYKKSLTDKYGKPYSEDTTSAGKQSILWATNDSKTKCLKDFGNYAALQNNKNISTTLFVIPDGKTAKDCVSGVTYQLTGDPVTATNAGIFDVAKIADSEQKTKDWLDGLEKDARAKVAPVPITAATAPVETPAETPPATAETTAPAAESPAPVVTTPPQPPVVSEPSAAAAEPAAKTESEKVKAP